MDIIIQIIIFAGLMLGLIIVFQVVDVESNNENQHNKVLLGSAIIETMDTDQNPRVGPRPDLAINMDEFSSQWKPEHSFCKMTGEDNLHTLNSDCNRLSKSNCLSVECCGFLNNEKCVQGGEFGPTWRSDSDGNSITIDSYYYMNKRCIGPGCPKTE